MNDLAAAAAAAGYDIAAAVAAAVAAVVVAASEAVLVDKGRLDPADSAAVAAIAVCLVPT